MCVVTEQAKALGLKAFHTSIDKAKHQIDLSDDEPANTHMRLAEEDGIDGAHAGFPCSQFSRLKSRPKAGYPGPLLDRNNMRGFPHNSPQQQAVLNTSLDLVDKSIAFLTKVRDSARRRGLRAVSTLENPMPYVLKPSDENLPWERC